MSAVLAIREQALVVGQIVALVVVLQGVFDSLFGQDRAVHLGGGQAFQGLSHSLVGQLHSLLNGLALDHLRSHGGGSDGRAAAEGLELHIHDDIIFDLQIDLHNVAALGVAHFTHAVGVLDDTHIPGVHKVVHNNFTV